MKQSRHKRILLALAIFAFAASSFSFMRPINADFNEATIFISPQTPTISSALNFTVDIEIGYIYLMTSYEVHVSWDPALLSLTKITKGVFLSNNSQISTTVYKLPDYNLGTLAYLETQVPTEPGTAVGTGLGNATLFRLTFAAIGTGQCTLHLYSTIVKLVLSTISNVVIDGYFNNQQLTYPYLGVNYNTTLTSNSTAHDLSFNLTAKTLTFNVSGLAGTTGYANVTIPRILMDVDPGQPPAGWVAMVDGVPTTSFIVTSNTTHTFIYLTYTHSDHSIAIEGNQVIPEITPDMFVLVLLFAALAMLPLLARRTERKHQAPDRQASTNQTRTS